MKRRGDEGQMQPELEQFDANVSNTVWRDAVQPEQTTGMFLATHVRKQRAVFVKTLKARDVSRHFTGQAVELGPSSRAGQENFRQQASVYSYSS